MTTWLLMGMALYLVTAYIPSLMLLQVIGVGKYLGTRDDPPEPKPHHARAIRARDNFRENLPVFLGLGLLVLITPEADQSIALRGAQTFVLSRLVYLPAYISGVPVVRSAVFMLGWCGLLVMALALL